MQGHGFLFVKRFTLWAWLRVVVVNTAVLGAFMFGARVGWELAGSLF